MIEAGDRGRRSSGAGGRPDDSGRLRAMTHASAAGFAATESALRRSDSGERLCYVWTSTLIDFEAVNVAG